MSKTKAIFSTVVKHTKNVTILTLALKGFFRMFDEGLGPNLPIGEKVMPAILNFFNSIQGLKENLPTVAKDGTGFTELDGYVWPTGLGISVATYAIYQGIKAIRNYFHGKQVGGNSVER